MQTSNISFLYVVSVILLFFSYSTFSQTNTKTDSVVQSLLNENHVTDLNDKGVVLINQEKYNEANIFFSGEIAKNDGNKEAYFNRGVTNWAMSNPASACRDWSAVLALGDTAAFKLLDKNCHGEMVIEDDTIPKQQYHKMWAAEKRDAKALSGNVNALTVADEMPQFTGGISALHNYISKSIKYPKQAIEQKVEGTVYVNFIISRKGKILFPYVVHGIGTGCDEEALRIIKNMPGWTPGKQKGRPALVRHTLPVRFALK